MTRNSVLGMLELSTALRRLLEKHYLYKAVTPGLMERLKSHAEQVVLNFEQQGRVARGRYSVDVEVQDGVVRATLGRNGQSPVTLREVAELEDYLLKLDQELTRRRSADRYKARLLEEASKLIAVVVEEGFDLSKASESFKDDFRGFLTKTWSSDE